MNDTVKKIKCRLCGKTVSRLQSHIFNTHKDVSYKEYYDTYLKKKKEGFCKCGKKTSFVSIKEGYKKYCSVKCSNSASREKYKETCLSKYGVDNVGKAKEIKEKIKETVKRKYNVNHVFQLDSVKNKIKETLINKYGVDNPTKSNKIKNKIKKTIKKKYGVDCVFQSNRIKERIKETNRNKCGYDYWHQSPGFQEVVKKNNLENWGVEYPNQTKENRKIVSDRIKESFPNRRKRNEGNLSNSETIFASYLDKLQIRYKQEYGSDKKFDFALFRCKELDCLVEIDGELWHGITIDSKGANDWKRFGKVPKGVKLVVIDSKKLGFGIREVIRVFGMDYKEWEKEMISNIPKTIKYPIYDESFLRRTWAHLTKIKETKKVSYEWINNNMGKSIIINFCPEYAYRKVDYKRLRPTLFYSPFSSKNYLEGLESIKNIPELIIKYMNVESTKIVVNKHSPEKMIAICSLGKTYISDTPLDNGSKDIIKFFNLDAYEVRGSK